MTKFILYDCLTFKPDYLTERLNELGRFAYGGLV